MPIPKPRPKEKQASYISRCHKFLHDENKTRKPKRSNEQISGICFGIWRRKDYSETQIKEAVEWYEARVKMTRAQAKKLGKKIVKKADKEAPSWVQTARKLLASKKGNPKLRAYWKKRLMAYEVGRK